MLHHVVIVPCSCKCWLCACNYVYSVSIIEYVFIQNVYFLNFNIDNPHTCAIKLLLLLLCLFKCSTIKHLMMFNILLRPLKSIRLSKMYNCMLTHLKFFSWKHSKEKKIIMFEKQLKKNNQHYLQCLEY